MFLKTVVSREEMIILRTIRATLMGRFTIAISVLIIIGAEITGAE
jgi:hypothetical protein